MTVGMVSPGAMGRALGRAWQRGGARVVCTVAGRSEWTQLLAVGLELLPSLGEVVEVSDVVMSVGPPGQALLMAVAIAAECNSTSSRPLVVDLNAVAPSTVRKVANVLSGAGCDFVDGSISGPPPNGTSTTRLYLSGRWATVVSGLEAPGLVTRIVGTEVGAASAVKMCTASVYKGFSGLLLRALQTARLNGVTDLVMADLSAEFNLSPAEAATRLALAVAKSDRYPAEMREIAATQNEAGADPELFEAMVRLFQTVSDTALGANSPEHAANMNDLDTVLALLGNPIGSQDTGPTR